MSPGIRHLRFFLPDDDHGGGGRGSSSVLDNGQDLGTGDQDLGRHVLTLIGEHPKLTISDLERALGDDSNRTAALPSLLAYARSDGLVGADDPTSPDAHWELTPLGREQLGLSAD